MSEKKSNLKFVDPYIQRRSEVVLTGYDEKNQLCYQEILSYENYYEETGHVFDEPKSIAARGIRRMHFVIWNSDGQMQSEAENGHDAAGKRIAGRHRDNPNQSWVADRF